MITLSTSPELEQQLEAEARKFGATPEQHALDILERSVAPLRPQLSDEESEAALDELFGCLADVAFGTQELRALKDEELALEEEKLQRLFGRKSGEDS